MQRLLERSDVMAVDGSDVFQAKVLEHALWGEGVLEAFLHGVQRVVERRPDQASPVSRVLISSNACS